MGVITLESMRWMASTPTLTLPVQGGGSFCEIPCKQEGTMATPAPRGKIPAVARPSSPYHVRSLSDCADRNLRRPSLGCPWTRGVGVRATPRWCDGDRAYR